MNENTLVSDLIESPGKWNVELIQQSFLSPDSELILTLPLSPFNHNDSWLWHYNKNGIYLVRSGYNLAVDIDSSGPSSSSEVLSTWWKAFWALKIPRKILIFGWRGYHEILPTTKDCTTEMCLCIAVVLCVVLGMIQMHMQNFLVPFLTRSLGTVRISICNRP